MSFRGFILFLSITIAASACTPLAPPPPIWPVSERAMTFSVSQGVPIAPTEVRVSPVDGEPETLRRVIQDRVVLIGFIDPTLGFNVRLAPRASMRLHAGLSNLGAGALIKRSGVQFDVAAQTHSPLFIGFCATCSHPWELRGQVAKQTEGAWPLLFGVGGSLGRRVHGVVLPEGPLASYGVDQQVPEVLRIYRNEARIEATLGAAVPWAGTQVWLTWQPYLTVAHGRAIIGNTNGNIDLHLESMKQTWGGTLLVTLMGS